MARTISREQYIPAGDADGLGLRAVTAVVIAILHGENTKLAEAEIAQMKPASLVRLGDIERRGAAGIRMRILLQVKRPYLHFF